MKMDKVAGSRNDEFYTPEYAILPILKYLKPNSNVWCPIVSHIENWWDFFNMIGSEFSENRKPLIIDYIISNPPYSLKTEVFEKLFELWIPFAMLVWVVWLFESQKRFEMFRDNEFEIMYLNRRVSYFKNYDDQKT